MSTPQYQVGEHVVYTNEFGVCFGLQRIDQVTSRNGKPAYVLENSDCPWCPTEQHRLKAAKPEDYIAHFRGDHAHFQKNHAIPITWEQRESLLDFDPFEGEA